jgi:hypothetical protein
MRTAKIKEHDLQNFLNYLADNGYELFKLDASTEKYNALYYIEFDRTQVTKLKED